MARGLSGNKLMKQCPCGSTLQYLECCGCYINGMARPNTPEALMRSRYTAYTLSNIDYIKKTMQGKPLAGFNEIEAGRWSKSVLWLGLKVVGSEQTELSGFVEFVARFLDKNWVKSIHEVSQFQNIDGSWFYVDGEQFAEPPVKISRNTACPCASKKKFKNCHEKNIA